MKRHTRMLGLSVFVLLAASLACASGNTGNVIATQAPGGQPAATPSPIYHVGDVVQFSDHTLTLTEARITGDILRTNFTVTNTSAKDVNIHSLISFDARLPDGTKLERDLFNCTGANFDGRVLAGESMQGSLCWGGTAGNFVKVYYIANIFEPGAAVWEIAR